MKTGLIESRGAALRSGASVLALAAMSTGVSPAFAQEEAASGGEEILVTGSRIAREDLNAPSPVSSVDSEQLTLTNTVNTEDFLNDLPQLVPAFDSTSNNPGDGTARIDLRGLGTGRTLVLVNGHRFVGEGISQVVDLNNIPAALIERVDVVTGGASAVYGSDAVAGVVNFILRDDYEGIEAAATYRLTGRGDGGILNISTTLGGNFADGRGNATISVGYTQRDALLQGEREFSRLTLQDVGPGLPFGSAGSSSIPGGRFRGFASSNFETPAAGLPAACDAGGVLDNDNNCSGFFVDGGALLPFRLGGANPANDFYNFAPTNYLQIPQERFNIGAFGRYEITDSIEAYVHGVFANSVVDSQLAPTPGVFEFGLELTVQENNPFLFGPTATPVGLQLGNLIQNSNAAGLRGDTNGDGLNEYQFRYRKRFEEVGPRNSLRDTSTYLIAGGLEGDLGDNFNWTLHGQFGRSAVNLTQTGNVSISAITAAVFNGTADIFNGPGSLQPAVATAIARTGAIYQLTEQTNIVGTIGGDVNGLQSPWASRPAAFVAGVEYREEYSLQQPDSVLGPDVLGFNQSVFVEGRYDVYEAFIEAEIPLIEDKPLFNHFGLNGAFRYSDYSTVGGVSSFAVGADWEVVDGARLRAQFQRAVRAPNIGELFLTPGNGFPPAGDPCSGGLNGGLWTALSSAQQAQLSARCVANGVPLAAVGTATQQNAQVQIFFSGFGSQLTEETADTLTIGGVFQPTFIDGLSFAIDYYNIDIGNVIGIPSAQAILDDCIIFNIASACSFVQRGPGGDLQQIGTLANPILNVNQVARVVKGIDLSLDYEHDLGSAGKAAFGFDGTHQLKNSIQGNALSTEFDCTATYGGVCGQPIPEWKFTSTLQWLFGPLTSQLRYSWISGVDEATGVRYENLAGLRSVTGTGAFGTFDVSFLYDVSESVQLQAGIDNIFAKEPPVFGSCCNEQANTWPGVYETLGRQVFFGAKLKF